MHFFDTSFLVPILPHETSDPITRFFADLAGENQAVSYGTRVEFSSLPAREVRRRTGPMGTFQDRTSMDRILFAVFSHQDKCQGNATRFPLTHKS